MASEEQNYSLLQHDDKAASQESLYAPRKSHSTRFIHLLKSNTSILTLLILSIVTNILLSSLFVIFGLQSIWKKHETPQTSYVDISPYGKMTIEEEPLRVSSDVLTFPIAGLARQPSFKFPYASGYGPTEITNHSLADELWEAIEIDPGIVAIPLDWAEEHNIAETQPFPWDSSKGLYVINAFHNIHCLVSDSLFLFLTQNSR